MEEDFLYGRTALHNAAELSNYGKAKWLIESGDDVNRADADWWTPLHYACLRGRFNIAELLVSRKGIDLEAANARKNTPLHWACHNGHTSIARLLVDNGAKLDAKNVVEQTPLHLACHYGHLDAATYLLERGSDRNAIEAATRRSPFQMAIHSTAHNKQNDFRRLFGETVSIGLLLHITC
jgi:ankyrin repeat protein